MPRKAAAFRISTFVLLSILLSACRPEPKAEANTREAPAAAKVDFPSASGYHAVFMPNLVLFGSLEGIGTKHPVLTDVYYVRQEMDPKTKEVSNKLIKRGNEWHGPDRMLLNADQILFIEPVNSQSRVATLIRELKNTK